jgi:hypothetical protein
MIKILAAGQSHLLGHGLPKINFNLPEAKLIDPNNVSHYETPISLSGP